MSKVMMNMEKNSETRIELNEEILETVNGGESPRNGNPYIRSWTPHPTSTPRKLTNREPDWHGPADVQFGEVNWKGWHGPARHDF